MNNIALFCMTFAAFLLVATPALAQDDAEASVEEKASAPVEEAKVPAPAADAAASASVEEPKNGAAQPDLGDTASGLLSALKAGRWLVAAGFILLLVGMGARKLIGLIAKDWSKTKTGGKMIGAGSAFAVAVGAGLSMGSGFSLDLILGAIGLAGAAAGLWSLAPDVAKDKLR